MSGPLVSIITPCYRQAHFLTGAIESALAQSYGGVQLVVVNDGSDDDTEAVASGYRDRIDYICKSNGGLPSARNAGIMKSEGQYLLFLDADDLLHPDAVAWLVEAMDGHEDRICVMGYRFFQSDPILDGQPDWLPHSNFSLSLFRYDPALVRQDEAGPPDNFSLLPYLIYTTFGPPHCFLCSKKMVVGAGSFEERLASCEDWDLWVRLALAGAHVVSVPRAGAYYRRYPGSMSTNPRRMLESRTEVLLRTHEQIVGQPELLRQWGSDLLQAEHQVRRRFLIQGLRSPSLNKLSQRMSQLQEQGIRMRKPRHLKLLESAFGSLAEPLALMYLRLVYPSIFSRYKEGYA